MGTAEVMVILLLTQHWTQLLVQRQKKKRPRGRRRRKRKRKRKKRPRKPQQQQQLPEILLWRPVLMERRNQGRRKRRRKRKRRKNRIQINLLSCYFSTQPLQI